MKRREALINASIFGSSFLARKSVMLFLGAVASPALALGEASYIGIGQLKHRGDWDARPEALRRLLWEAAKRTSINAARDASAVDVGPKMFKEPLLVLAGANKLPPFDQTQRAALARHLRFGGVLWIDAADDAFYDSARAELAKILPTSRVKTLDKEHVLFKSYYLLKGGKAHGRLGDNVSVSAAAVHDRAAVLLTRCDVLGAFERDKLGTWRFECTPGGDRQRELAFRFGVNVLMYATCLDYKADQVHIPFIMKKKRR